MRLEIVIQFLKKVRSIRSIYESHSCCETQNIAKALSRYARRGSVFALFGDLGAGKTAFTQGLCAALGASQTAKSPTFGIIHEYYGALPVYHLDLYRLSNERELFDIGGDEYFCSDGVCIVEWAQRCQSLLPVDTIKVIIERNAARGADYRSIVVEGGE